MICLHACSQELLFSYIISPHFWRVVDWGQPTLSIECDIYMRYQVGLGIISLIFSSSPRINFRYIGWVFFFAGSREFNSFILKAKATEVHDFTNLEECKPKLSHQFYQPKNWFNASEISTFNWIISSSFLFNFLSCRNF